MTIYGLCLELRLYSKASQVYCSETDHDDKLFAADPQSDMTIFFPLPTYWSDAGSERKSIAVSFMTKCFILH